MQTSQGLANVSRNYPANPCSVYTGYGAEAVGAWFGLLQVVFASQAFCILVLNSFLFLENKCVAVS